MILIKKLSSLFSFTLTHPNSDKLMIAIAQNLQAQWT